MVYLNFDAITLIIAYGEDSLVFPNSFYEDAIYMKQKSAELKVGILALLSIIVLVAGTLFVGNFHLFQKTYLMDVYFDFVNGLQEGAPVQLDGVKMGTVKKITVHPERNHPIVVTLQLPTTTKMRQNARIYVDTMGLMGEKYVEIDAGSSNLPFLTQGLAVNGENPTDMQDILNSTKEVVENLKNSSKVISDVLTNESTKNVLFNFMVRLDNVSKNINDLVAQRRPDIDKFAVNLRILSENMKGVVNEMNDMIKENSGNIQKVTSNMAQISEDIRAHSAKISENLDALTEQLRGTATEGRPDLQTTLKNFRDASEEFKKSMEKLDTITSRVEQGKGTVGKLVSDDGLYNQATATMSSVRSAASMISSGGKMFGGIEIDYEMRYRGEVNRFRNDINIRMTPNDEKYYLLGASDIGGDVGLDLMYVRREGPLDIKLGILESKASAGFDYNLFKNRLTMGVLGVGLTGKTRLDIQSYLLLGKYWDVNWYAVAGGDDLTREPRASAGIQMRY